MLEQELQSAGLSVKQAKVYLALLELGKSNVQAIAKKTDIKRATVYVILSELMRLGLASAYIEDKKTYFISESCERLLYLWENKIQDMERKEKELAGILPELTSMRQKREAGPIVEFFSGKDGVKKAIRQVLKAKAGSEVQMFYDNDLIAQYFSQSEREAIRDARQKRKIKTKIIYTSKAGGLPIQSKSDLRRRIAATEFSTTCDITLYDDKVQIASLGQEHPSGIIITDESVHESFVSLFKLAWLGAQEVKSP